MWVVYQGLFARRAWESCDYCRKYAVSAPRGKCHAELLAQGRGAGDGQGKGRERRGGCKMNARNS